MSPSRSPFLPLLAVLAMVTTFVSVGAASPDPVVASQPGLTEAPDLLSVGNFREGPRTDDGQPQTLVDFTFDQAAFLNGGDRSAFHLTPLDADLALDGRGTAPAGDTAGDAVVQVLFEGDLDAADHARGFVDTGIVNSNESNVGPDNPANITQSEPITDGGTTENPDLADVQIDGDQVIFTFDEPLTSDDVVQNNGGLRIFFPETDQGSTPPDAGALSVKRRSDTELRAFYGDDLPEGYELGDAVGAFIRPGSVQAAEGSRGARDGVNALHEFAPLGDTGAEVCPVAPQTGEQGAGDGLTEAPDLLEVGNVRRGPFTTQFEPTTCVDFVFDQPAFLTGGDRSKFSLVPQDGGDALPGSTNVTPEQDQSGDRVVTVVFPGDLSAEDFARGFVDSETVNSDEAGASADAPLNINQSEPIDPTTATQNPDLASVQLDGDAVLWTFDQALTDDDVAQNSSGLRLYFPETDSGSTIPFAASAGVERVAPDQLRAFYPEDLPEGYELADAVGGYLVQGSVQAVQGERGGNMGTNAFDELAPLGDTGAEVCAPAPQTGEAGDGSGLTEAPDLLEVGNLRRGPTTSQFTSTTCVDFVFDQPAFLNGGDKSNFALVPTDAGDALSGSTNVDTPGDEQGDRVVTIAFPGTLSPEDVARGVVSTGVVNSDPDTINAEDPANINQSAAIEPGTATANPDIASVQLDGDQVLWNFDQDLTDDDVTQNNSGLRLYFPETDSASTIPFAGSSAVKRVDADTLRAFYGEDLPEGYELSDAVGAYLVQGSVQAAPGAGGGNDGNNAFDELAPLGDTGAEVCPAAPQTGEAGDRSGPTEGPDLLEVGNVRRGPFTSQFTPTTCVDFVFDQPAFLNGGNRANFSVVPLDASDAVSGSTNVLPEDDQPGDRVVTVAFPGDFTAEEFARGFVDTGVVNSDETDVSADSPLNVNQSEDLSPSTVTGNPDLVSARQDGSSSVLFEFDEDLTSDDVAQNSSGLRLYFAQAQSGATVPSAGSVDVTRIDARTLRASYRDLPGGRTVADAVGAFVDQGAVQAAQGSREGNDGTNAFDEVVLGQSMLTGLTCDGEPATITGSGFIPGTEGADVIVGSDVADDIDARGGDDLVCGLGGADDISGGEGDDTLYADRATTTGSDTSTASFEAASVRALQTDDDADAGAAGTERDGAPFATASSHGRDTVSGGAGADTVVGSEGPDELSGGPGDDRLDGRGGDDSLDGGAGDDDLDGGPGDDTLAGGPGNDRLDGGEGADSLDGGEGDDMLTRDADDSRVDGGEGRDDCGSDCDDADAADRGETRDRDTDAGGDEATGGDAGTDAGTDGDDAGASPDSDRGDAAGAPVADDTDGAVEDDLARTGAATTSLLLFALLALGLGALLLRSGGRRHGTAGSRDGAAGSRDGAAGSRVVS